MSEPITTERSENPSTTAWMLVRCRPQDLKAAMRIADMADLLWAFDMCGRTAKSDRTAKLAAEINRRNRC